MLSSTNLDSKSLQTIVSGVNVMSKVQCDFADGICGNQPPYRISLINWEMQPQVFKKETVIGELEETII